MMTRSTVSSESEWARRLIPKGKARGAVAQRGDGLRGVVSAFAAVLALLLASISALARQADAVGVRAELTAYRVYVGEPVKLIIRVDGSRGSTRPTLPDIPGVEHRFEGEQDVSQSFVSIINGRRSEHRTEGFVYQYELTPTRVGVITIPPIVVEVAGRSHATEEMTLHVIPAQEDRDVKLRLEVDNPAPYVGEPIRLRVVLALARSAATADFSIPGVEAKFELVDDPAPAQQWRDQAVFGILGAQVPAQQGSEVIDGVPFTTFTAERVLIPREAGRHAIGPASARVEVIVRRGMSIFDRDQTRRAVVPSNTLMLNVKPLPTEGRPANFNGLIGRYRVSTKASPTDVSVGDPITLEIRVDGPLAAGVAPPAIERQSTLTEGFRVTSEATPGSMDGRTKVFTRVIRAQRPGISEIPPIELPYFDTEQGRYAVARSEPIPIQVRPTRLVTAADAETTAGASAAPASIEVREHAGGIRFNYEGPELLRDQSFDLALAVASPAGIAVIAVPPALWAAALGLALVRRRAADLSPAARRRRAIAEARRALAAIGDDPVAASQAVSGAVRRLVAAAFDREGQSLTSGECVELVRRKNEEEASALAALLTRCDAALYGGAPPGEAGRLRQEASALIDRLECTLEGGRQ